MTNAQDKDALDAVNRDRTFFSPRVQNTVASILVALIVVILNRGCAAWDRLSDLDDNYRIHVNDGLRKHALLEKDLERLSECLMRLRDVEEELAHLPQELAFPFNAKWQDRILENTNSLNRCGCGVQNLNSRGTDGDR